MEVQREMEFTSSVDIEISLVELGDELGELGEITVHYSVVVNARSARVQREACEKVDGEAVIDQVSSGQGQLLPSPSRPLLVHPAQSYPFRSVHTTPYLDLAEILD